MKWITREHVKVDRVACPWLIKKFVDKDAEFIFAPSDKVMLDAIVDRDLGHEEWRVLNVTDNVVTLRHAGKTIDVVGPLAYVLAVYRAELPTAEWVVDLSCYVSKHRTKPLIVVTKAQPFGRNDGHYRDRGMDNA